MLSAVEKYRLGEELRYKAQRDSRNAFALMDRAKAALGNKPHLHHTTPCASSPEYSDDCVLRCLLDGHAPPEEVRQERVSLTNELDIYIDRLATAQERSETLAAELSDTHRAHAALVAKHRALVAMLTALVCGLAYFIHSTPLDATVGSVYASVRSLGKARGTSAWRPQPADREQQQQPKYQHQQGEEQQPGRREGGDAADDQGRGGGS